MSESEQALKGTSQIKLLSSEDIEGMRLVCRVSVFYLMGKSTFQQLLERKAVTCWITKGGGCAL